jgi:hypothetical protein
MTPALGGGGCKPDEFDRQSALDEMKDRIRRVRQNLDEVSLPQAPRRDALLDVTENMSGVIEQR